MENFSDLIINKILRYEFIDNSPNRDIMSSKQVATFSVKANLEKKIKFNVESQALTLEKILFAVIMLSVTMNFQTYPLIAENRSLRTIYV